MAYPFAYTCTLNSVKREVIEGERWEVEMEMERPAHAVGRLTTRNRAQQSVKSSVAKISLNLTIDL